MTGNIVNEVGAIDPAAWDALKAGGSAGLMDRFEARMRERDAEMDSPQWQRERIKGLAMDHQHAKNVDICLTRLIRYQADSTLPPPYVAPWAYLVGHRSWLESRIGLPPNDMLAAWVRDSAEVQLS